MNTTYVAIFKSFNYEWAACSDYEYFVVFAASEEEALSKAKEAAERFFFEQESMMCAEDGLEPEQYSQFVDLTEFDEAHDRWDARSEMNWI